MSTTFTIEPGTTIGPYRVRRGFDREGGKREGGMSHVFEVEVRPEYHKPNLPNRLALKVAKEDHQKALVAEADLLAKCSGHPNVVQILPLAGFRRATYAARSNFPFGWGWFYTMEFVEGKTLDDYMAPSIVTSLLNPSPEIGQQLSLYKILNITHQLTTALQHVHKQHIVHLDVKPQNIILRTPTFGYLSSNKQHLVLCDFGIAREILHRREEVLGIATAEYASPEQARDSKRNPQTIDVRSDIFSLGIMLYQMLTGRLPFRDIAQTTDRNYAPDPPSRFRPSIPRQLEAITLKALAKSPSDRYQSIAEIQEILKTVPTQPDWEAARQRIFAGMSLTACIACAGLSAIAGHAIISASEATPTPIVRTITPSPSPSATTTPKLTPTTAPQSTVTKVPTHTPTKTPRPVTPAPTVAPTLTPRK